MPILTNYELHQYRLMAAFATRLLDLINSVDGNNGIDLKEQVNEIADVLGIKLPIEENQ